ncbi:MAG TPA: hypothetical protein VFF03_13915 [Rhodocyclaceae bacterium]|nr:hypothetical protein [Rhodocyclaceae bacterium]
MSVRPLLLCFIALFSLPALADDDCAQISDPGLATRMGMIRKLMDTGRPYAALAHLESTGAKGPAADQLRADILRRTGRSEDARRLYRGLLSTCLAPAGHHGLGLLAGQEGRLKESLDHLRQARQGLAVDARVRSDLGYALMLSGDLEGARFEFLTAQDLDPEDRKAALNLALLYYLQGKPAEAESLGRRHQMDDKELAKLRQEAARLAGQQGDRQ